MATRIHVSNPLALNVGERVEDATGTAGRVLGFHNGGIKIEWDKGGTSFAPAHHASLYQWVESAPTMRVEVTLSAGRVAEIAYSEPDVMTEEEVTGSLDDQWEDYSARQYEPAPAPRDLSKFAMSFPVIRGEVVMQGHADYCKEYGHATHTSDGVIAPYCPRCGDTLTAPYKAAMPLTIGDVFPIVLTLAEPNMTCGTCGGQWNDKEVPTPANRCPFEYDHEEPEEDAEEVTLTYDSVSGMVKWSDGRVTEPHPNFLAWLKGE